MSDVPATSGYIPTLDGWRALAILMVLAAHGAPLVARSAGVPEAAVIGWSTRAALGVDVFFGISGFLICSRLLQEQVWTGTVDLRVFYLRRAFRILPPFWAVLAILALLAGTGLIHVQPGEWVSSLLFYRNYLPTPEGGWYTGHFWSLAIEEHFYLLWPAVIYFWLPRTALGIALAGVGTVAIWRTAAYRVPALREVFGDVSFFARTDTRIDALLFGCVAALLMARYGRVLARHASAVWTVAIGAAYILCVASSPFLSLSWQGLLIAMAIASTALQPKGVIGRILEWEPLKQVGRYSYSVYLWQQIFLPPQSDVAVPYAQNLPLCVMLLGSCAFLSYHLIEQPFIRLGRRLAVSGAASTARMRSATSCVTEASR